MTQAHGGSTNAGGHAAQPKTTDRSRGRRPDLLIDLVRDVNPAAYEASATGYIMVRAGEARRTIVMESRLGDHQFRTNRRWSEKRDEYAALGIAEYWRFDQSGEYHGTRLGSETA